mmetsp:Transcript_30815/g.92622  ORF Transcript_30815/g.92622 Transcript_30815/m.92622 type:complete len:109 (-) Transcript_30815:256-582(-)
MAQMNTQNQRPIQFFVMVTQAARLFQEFESPFPHSAAIKLKCKLEKFPEHVAPPKTEQDSRTLSFFFAQECITRRQLCRIVTLGTPQKDIHFICVGCADVSACQGYMR